MRKRGIRGLCLLLALAVVLGLGVSGALAEGWTCLNCGQAGNTGNFCANCGTAEPANDWDCPSCGQAGNTGNFCTNCGAARPAAGGAGGAVNEALEQIPGETDRVKVCLQGVDASSFITNRSNPVLWVPGNAADGNESTCWQFSAKKGLKGKSWLDLLIGDGQDVSEIWFKNGFWAYNDKGGDQYGINARLKDVRVSFLYSGESGYRDEVALTLRDEARNGWQRFDLGQHRQVIAVRVAVWSTYKGSHYQNDVCLSEVMLVQNAPAATARAPQESGTAVVYESRPEVSGAPLLMKLATRSGPGTQYDEPGTFFGSNWQDTIVRVLGRYWDGSIWWVQVDFSNGGKASYRVWTGLKRVDVNIDRLQEVYPSGQGTVSSTSETYRGPGGKYARAKVTINGWKDVVSYGRENGYVEVEFEQSGKLYRVWVPEAVTSIDWGNDFSGEN